MVVARVRVLGTLFLYLQVTSALPGCTNVNQNKPTLVLSLTNNQGIHSQNVGPTISNRMIEFRQNAQNNIANLASAQQNDAQSSSNLGPIPATAGVTNLALVLTNPSTTDALKTLISRNGASQSSGADQSSSTVSAQSAQSCPFSILPISIINRISATPLQADFVSLQNQQRTALPCSTPATLGNSVTQQTSVLPNQIQASRPVCNRNVATVLSNQAFNSLGNQPIIALSQNPSELVPKLSISSLQLYPNTQVTVPNLAYSASPSPYQNIQHSEEPKNSNLKMLLPLLFDLLKEKDRACGCGCGCGCRCACGCNCNCKCCCNQDRIEQPQVSSGYASEVKYGELVEESAPAVAPDEKDNEIDGGMATLRERKSSDNEASISGETIYTGDHPLFNVEESTRSSAVETID